MALRKICKGGEGNRGGWSIHLGKKKLKAVHSGETDITFQAGVPGCRGGKIMSRGTVWLEDNKKSAI